MEERSDKGTWPQNTIGVGKNNARRLIQDLITLRACISASVSQYSAAKKIEEEAELTIHNLNSEIGKTLAAIQKLKHTFAQNNGNAQTISTRKERLSLAKIVEENATVIHAVNTLVSVSICLSIALMPILLLTVLMGEYVFFGGIALLLVGLWISCLCVYANAGIRKIMNADRKHRTLFRLEVERGIGAQIPWEKEATPMSQEIEQQVKPLKEKIKELRAQIKKVKEQTQRETFLLCKQSSIAIALVEKEFVRVLPLENWRYLDKIIDLLRTCRAETVSEALLQIDSHRINAARVNLKIQDDLRSYAGEMHAQFARIAERLFYQLHRSFDETTEEGKAEVEAISPFITAEALKNALLGNVEVSSKTLSEQVAWLQERAK